MQITKVRVELGVTRTHEKIQSEYIQNYLLEFGDYTQDIELILDLPVRLQKWFSIECFQIQLSFSQ